MHNRLRDSISKTPMHNRIRDSIFYVTQQLAPTGGLVTGPTAVTTEPTHLLDDFALKQPGDIALDISPGSPCPWSKVLIDITTIPYPPRWHDPNNNNTVDRHHELNENRKFHCSQPEIATSIVNHRFALIPCKVDPGGLLGPCFTSFLLMGTDKPHQPTLRPSNPRPTASLTTPAIKTLAQRSKSILSHTNLFSLANHNYQEQHPDQGYTIYPTQYLPGQWATHTIGLNLVLALGTPIHNCLAKPNTKPKLYAAAATQPRRLAPTLTLEPQVSLSMAGAA